MAGVLVVEDDLSFGRALVRKLENAGYSGFSADCHEAAMAAAAQHAFGAAVVDLSLPGPSGLVVLRDLRSRHPRMRLLAMSTYTFSPSSIKNIAQSLRVGAAAFLDKLNDIPGTLLRLLAADESQPPLDVDASVPTLARAQRDHLDRVVLACEGNLSLAARQLGLHRQSLQRMLRKKRPAR